MVKEDRCIELAKHCVGLDRKNSYTRHGKKWYKPYRNYYDAGGRDIDIWTELWRLGYAEKGKRNRYDGCMFWLTRKGLDWLGSKLGIYIYDEEQ